MNRLEKLLLFILDRAQKEGKADLSNFQMFKIPYLIQVYSFKYTGVPFVSDTTFIRQKNGPISIDIYNALKKLEGNYIKKEVIENKAYGYPKYAFSLVKKIPSLGFDSGEVVFLDSFLSELLPLTQSKLKERAYATEPMLDIQKKEKTKGILSGSIINFNTIAVDPDIVDTYSNS